ncbi:MAG: class I SAM-dependent methyltransferase [Pseudomonadota bacterium]
MIGKLWREVTFMVAFGATPRIILRYLLDLPHRRRAARKLPEAEQEADGLSLSRNWIGTHGTHWKRVLDRVGLHEEGDWRILEIGSFEGRSAVHFLRTFPRAHLTCVDPWQPYAGIPDYTAQHEARFDANTAPYADRLRKFKGASQRFFVEEAREEIYDIVYVDGDHSVNGAMVDMIGATSRLKDGGVLLLDDYFLLEKKEGTRPTAAAVNAFIRMHGPEIKILFVGYTVILQKMALRS